MLRDRYDLGLSTGSAAARDAYVQASDLALTFYPGAAEAYDRAIAADPGFALAHAGKAQVLMREGSVAAARAALTAAKDAATGVSERGNRAQQDERGLPIGRREVCQRLRTRKAGRWHYTDMRLRKLTKMQIY